jgi:hypothetical protein
VWSDHTWRREQRAGRTSSVAGGARVDRARPAPWTAAPGRSPAGGTGALRGPRRRQIQCAGGSARARGARAHPHGHRVRAELRGDHRCPARRRHVGPAAAAGRRDRVRGCGHCENPPGARDRCRRRPRRGVSTTAAHGIRRPAQHDGVTPVQPGGVSRPRRAIPPDPGRGVRQPGHRRDDGRSAHLDRKLRAARGSEPGVLVRHIRPADAGAPRHSRRHRVRRR